MTPRALRGLRAAALGVVLVANGALAQDLPPELTGDYTNIPAPQPTPRAAQTPPPAPPARTAPAPRANPPSTPAPSRPPSDEVPLDPELGDVGPVSDEEPPPAAADDPTEAPVEELPTDDAVEPSDAIAEPPPAQRWSLGAGFGAGTLSFSRPASGGVQKLGTTPYAAFDLDVRGWLGMQNELSFIVHAHYQTSLGWALQHDSLFGLPETIAVRSQSVSLSVAPTLRLADGLHVSVPIGAELRWFVPKVHQYPLDPYTLGSLLVRAELIAALSESVTVRIGPEVHWIGFVNASLEREGACCSGGMLGAQASVQARLGRSVSLALDLREARALIDVAARFSAIERMATARLVGDL